MSRDWECFIFHNGDNEIVDLIDDRINLVEKRETMKRLLKETDYITVGDYCNGLCSSGSKVVKVAVQTDVNILGKRR